jgi:hypothetical protein
MTYSEEVLVGKRILLISPEYWGINFVSKHHYAIQLAKKNEVYFLNPPSDKNDLSSINKNLYVTDYKVHLRGINHFPGIARNLFNKLLIKKIKSICKVETYDIVWSFDPFRFQNLKIFKSPLSIYHAVDVHDSRLESEIVKSSDIVFANSDLILSRLKDNPKRYKIGHGLSDHFKTKHFRSVSKNKIITVGYVGNLQLKHIDTSTLSTIVENNPDIEFHFIGPYLPGNLSNKTYHNQFINFLKQKKNVTLHGPIPSVDLPKQLAKFDMFIMCYSSDENKNALSNSHKILEYLSTGKAVVSHFIDEYKNRSDLLEMANQNKEIPDIFKNVVANLDKYNSSELQIKRRTFAYENTYENILKKIDHLIRTM